MAENSGPKTSSMLDQFSAFLDTKVLVESTGD
jgi:hypothetical protein